MRTDGRMVGFFQVYLFYLEADFFGQSKIGHFHRQKDERSYFLGP